MPNLMKRISGTDLTGHNGLIPDPKAKFPSDRTRNLNTSVFSGNTHLLKGGHDTDYNFAAEGDEGFDWNLESDQVIEFNSQLDLVSDLPSTRNVSRFNAQNKG